MISPALRARLTSWIDMMLSPPSSKKLSSMPTRSTPRTSANSPHRISSCGVRGSTPRPPPRVSSGAGSARRSSLPFGVSGSRSSNNDRRRHHVVRQPPRQRGPKRRRHQAHSQPPQPRSPPAAAGRRGPSAHHRSLRHPGLAQKRRLDLARLNAEPAQLDLRVRTPDELQNPVRTPPRQVPGAVHPAARRPVRVRHKPLRGQAKPPQIAPRQSQPRDVELPDNTKRHRQKTAVQHINPRVPDRTTNRHVSQ